MVLDRPEPLLASPRPQAVDYPSSAQMSEAEEPRADALTSDALIFDAPTADAPTVDQPTVDWLVSDRLLAALSDAQLSARLVEVFSAEQRLAAQRLALIAEIHGRGQPRREGATCTTTWLRDILRVGVGTASGMLRLARALAAPAMGATAEAMMQGQVNTDQAAVIGRVIGDLPGDLDPGTIARAEQVLLGYATQFAARDLAVLGSRVLDHVAPQVADEHQRQQLERQETKAWRERGFTLTPDGQGRVRLRGMLDTESAATVTTAIDALCAPAHRAPETNPETETSVEPDGHAAQGGDGLGDERTAAQKRADALVEVCRLAMACGQLPAHGGEPPQLMVMMPYIPTHAATGTSPNATDPNATDPNATDPNATGPSSTSPNGTGLGGTTPGGTGQRAQADRDDTSGFAGSAGSDCGGQSADGTPIGWLDNGEALSPAAVRRFACDVGVIPVVLGGAGQVLDVGRMRRLFTGAIRKALIARDLGCAFPGCDRPPRWTEGHHIESWLAGGVTSVDNGVLVCRLHHRLIHEGSWQVRLGPDRLPEFIPPSFLDPKQLPRRNHYHRRT